MQLTAYTCFWIVRIKKKFQIVSSSLAFRKARATLNGFSKILAVLLNSAGVLKFRLKTNALQEDICASASMLLKKMLYKIKYTFYAQNTSFSSQLFPF